MLKYAVALSVLGAPLAFSQAPDGNFTKQDLMIPARDGVKLHTVVFTCANAGGALPILFVRTPYGAPRDTRALLTYSDLVADGYIFAFQDIRGRFTSEGQFVMQRQVRDKRDPKAIDESTDAYDSIEWMMHNVPGNNGRVGITGVSLRRLADDNGAAGAASGTEGGVAAGVASRYVSGRRLPP